MKLHSTSKCIISLKLSLKIQSENALKLYSSVCLLTKCFLDLKISIKELKNFVKS